MLAVAGFGLVSARNVAPATLVARAARSPGPWPARSASPTRCLPGTRAPFARVAARPRCGGRGARAARGPAAVPRGRPVGPAAPARRAARRPRRPARAQRLQRLRPRALVRRAEPRTCASASTVGPTATAATYIGAVPRPRRRAPGLGRRCSTELDPTSALLRDSDALDRRARRAARLGRGRRGSRAGSCCGRRARAGGPRAEPGQRARERPRHRRAGGPCPAREQPRCAPATWGACRTTGAAAVAAAAARGS